MKTIFYKFFILFVVISIIQGCSSSNFSKRKYLSGRYVDKIEKPAKINTDNSTDFKLQEFALSADNGTTEFPIIFNEDTIPKISLDTAAAAKGKSNELPNNNDDVIYFSPDSVSKINKKEIAYNLDDAKKQLIFNDKLKRAAFKLFFAWLIRVMGFIAIFLYVLLAFSSVLSSFVSLMFFGLIILFILFASLYHNYLAFNILMDADKMRVNNPSIKNLGWFYLLLGLNFYLVLIAVYYLLWMLFYGAVMLFFAAI